MILHINKHQVPDIFAQQVIHISHTIQNTDILDILTLLHR